MPILFQKWISEEDLLTNSNVLYLFGDNEGRKGMGGQAKYMRGKPNAVGVATKATPSHDADAYWSDTNYDAQCGVIDADLKRATDHLARGGIVVIPWDGLGTGLSHLPEKAPLTFAYLTKALRDLVKTYDPDHPVRDQDPLPAAIAG